MTPIPYAPRRSAEDRQAAAERSELARQGVPLLTAKDEVPA